MTKPFDVNGPIRIAYLTYRGKPHVGGQGVYSRHLTKALVDLGHHVEVKEQDIRLTEQAQKVFEKEVKSVAKNHIKDNHRLLI